VCWNVTTVMLLKYSCVLWKVVKKLLTNSTMGHCAAKRCPLRVCNFEFLQIRKLRPIEPWDIPSLIVVQVFHGLLALVTAPLEFFRPGAVLAVDLTNSSCARRQRTLTSDQPSRCCA
jgi:hypothetical protein